MQVALGEIKRLIVTLPPRHGKSELISKYFPAWYLGVYPDKRVMLASYEASFAATWGRKARDVLTEYGSVLFQVDVSQSSSAADQWDIAGHTGGMSTAGIGGSLTGRGANLMILDDVLKNAEEAASQTIKEKHWEWFQSTAYTRLEPDASVIVVMTRWHEADLVGHLLSENNRGDEPWTVFSFPALAEANERVTLRYPMQRGVVAYERKIGEALWAARFTAERLQAIKTTVGSRVWAALYQQHPSPDAGLIWRREWFSQRYTAVPACQMIIQTIDSAFKTGVANDFTSIATWGQTPTGYYLLDLFHARVEFPELKRAVVDSAAKWKPHAVLIEDKASGQSVIQELRRETILPIVAFSPHGSKESRAAAVSPIAESNKLWLPDAASWLSDWIEEHIAFPNAAHDDMCDTTVMALEYLAYGKGVSGQSILNQFKAYQQLKQQRG